MTITATASLPDMIQQSLAQEHLDFRGQPYALLLATSLVLWTLFYWVLKRRWPEHKSEWHCRIVTLVHGLLICSLGIIVLFVVDWRVPFYHTNQGRASTHFMQFTFAISLAYFIFDLVWCIAHNSEGAMMLFHHLCTILGYSVALYAGRWGTELTATILGTELSNPLLQIRWFLRDSGLRSSALGRLVDLLFIGSFGFNRLVLGSYLLYTYLSNPRTDFLGRLGSVVIYTIGWMFWMSIVAYSYRKYVCPRRAAVGPVAGDQRLVTDSPMRERKSAATLNGEGVNKSAIAAAAKLKDGVVYRSFPPSYEERGDSHHAEKASMVSSSTDNPSNGAIH